MGELPPLHTPQGPGVPRALRPGLPRVDSSASFPFLPLPCVQFSPVLSTSFPTPLPPASFPFLPFPCVQFSPVLSTLVRAYLLGMVPLPRLCFPLLSPSLRPVLSSSVTFSSASPQLPPASFPFLPFPFVQFSPVLSTLVRFVLPPSSRPLGVPTLPRSPSGSRVPPPLFRGSVSVARGSRRSAPTPLHRSGKSNRNGSDT